MATEQLLASRWATYVAEQEPAARRGRLSDANVHSAAVRIEVLQAVGKVDATTALLLHTARKRRNYLQHKAGLAADAGTAGMAALLQMLREFLDYEPVWPARTTEVNW